MDATDFITVVLIKNEFHLRMWIKEKSKWVTVEKYETRQEAETAELTIKDAWEEDISSYCTECREGDHDVCSMTPGCPCCDETIAAGLR